MGNSYDDALRAINEMFNDRGYSQVECKDNLKGLRDEVDILIDAISVDISNNE